MDFLLQQRHREVKVTYCLNCMQLKNPYYSQNTNGKGNNQLSILASGKILIFITKFSNFVIDTV